MSIDTPTAAPTPVPTDAPAAPRWTTHRELQAWIEQVVTLTTPDAVHVCDGSDAEWTRLTDALVETGTLTRLQAKPNSFLAQSDPTDVARVEDRTFICSVDEKDAGPDEQLDGPGRDEGRPHRAVPRLDDRPDPVRRPVRHGPPRRRAARCSAWSSPTPPTSSRR